MRLFPLQWNDAKEIRIYRAQDSTDRFVTNRQNILKFVWTTQKNFTIKTLRSQNFEIEVEAMLDEGEKRSGIIQCKVEIAIQDITGRHATAEDDIPMDSLKELGENNREK